jgi:hypothetical protein
MKNNIKPKIWGPCGWNFIHYVALGYPTEPTENDKENYKNFFYSLQHILPCQKCADNFKENIEKHPIDNYLDNQNSLTKWTFDIHNMVNKENNKPILSYDEAINIYIYRSELIKNIEKNIHFYIIIFILIIIIIILFYLKYKR